jgi:hypothetical protein
MMQAQLDARKALQPATEALYKALILIRLLRPSDGRGPTLSCCYSVARAERVFLSVKASIATEAAGLSSGGRMGKSPIEYAIALLKQNWQRITLSIPSRNERPSRSG